MGVIPHEYHPGFMVLITPSLTMKRAGGDRRSAKRINIEGDAGSIRR